MTSDIHYPVESGGGLRQALRVQARVIGALILRDIRAKFGRHRIGYLAAIGDPILHTAVWLLILTFLRPKHGSHDMTPLLMVLTGVMPVRFFQNISGSIKGAWTGQGRNLLDNPLIRNADFLISQLILELVTMLIVTFLVFGIMLAWNLIPPPAEFSRCMGALGILLLCATGFGVFNSVFCVLSGAYRIFMSVSRRLIYLSSGIFFLGDNIPPERLNFVLWNPIFHCVEMFRSGYSFGYESAIANPYYPIAFGTILLFLGLAAERAAYTKLLAKSEEEQPEESDFI